MIDRLIEIPLWKLARPDLVLFTFFTYLVGVGIAIHLGIQVSFLNGILGLLEVICMIELTSFLSAYFDHPDSPTTLLHVDDPYRHVLLNVKRKLLLQIAMVVLSAGATFTMFLILRKAISPSSLLLIGISLLACFFSAAPPFLFGRKGFGVLVEGIVLINLVPAIGYSLQGDSPHILLIMTTLPLWFIYMSMKIATSLETYSADLVFRKPTLSIALGWQKAMTIHTLLILGAYLLIGISLLLGFPWSLAWPMLITLPVAGFEVFQMAQIREGAKPGWRLLKSTSIGLFLLITYLLIIALWI